MPRSSEANPLRVAALVLEGDDQEALLVGSIIEGVAEPRSLLEAPEASQHRAAWDAEIAARIEEVEAGKAELVSWEDARAQIFGRGVSK